MPEEKNKGNAGVWAVVVLVLAVAVYGLFSYVKRETPATEIPTNLPVAPTATTPTGATSPASTPVAQKYLYKNGSYSAIGNYTSPGGAEEVGVKLEVLGDVITNVSVEVKATRPASKNWQNAFAGGVKSVVVGKKLDEVKLDKVSGSSLTPKGWNDAILKIQKQAQA